MRMFACGTVLFALACGGGGAPATPTTPSSLPALSSPELTGCVVPGAGRLAALSVGEQLANDGRGVDHAAPADLTVLAPELAARGARIALATPAQLDDDAMAELLVIAEPQRAVNTIDARTFELHFYDCTQHGLRPLGPPVERFADAVTVEVQSGELVTRGAVGHTLTSVRMLLTQPTMEYLVVEYLFGRTTETLPVQQPRGESLGVLARWEVGAQVLVPDSSVDYARTDVLAASGWYPHGDGSAAYLALRVSSGPDTPTPTTAFGTVTAVLDGQGARGRDPFDPAWALLGTGPRPTWCDAAPARLRCAALDADTYELGFTWIAGVWPDGDAARAALQAAGATLTEGTWLYLGAVDESDASSLPASPTGETAAIVFVPLSVRR